MRKAIKGLPPKIQQSQKLKIKTVCHNCNNQWMSQLETKTIPILRPLLTDFSLPLEVNDQIVLATWAAKVALVFDSIYQHTHFYTKNECVAFNLTGAIPVRTKIWIGRYFGNAQSANLSDFTLNHESDLKVANGCVTTIIAGHVVFQILSMKFRPDYEKRSLRGVIASAPWERLLTQIWPNGNTKITWPPPLSFTLYGQFTVKSLFNRFNPRSV
jgi:hypothetical protein